MFELFGELKNKHVWPKFNVQIASVENCLQKKHVCEINFGIKNVCENNFSNEKCLRKMCV